MKGKLFLDFDGVIANSTKAYCYTYNGLYGGKSGFTVADPDKVNQWDLKDQCTLVDNPLNIFGMKSFFLTLDFMPGAQDVIGKLSEKYDIVICSIGTYDNLQYKAKWINDRLPFVDAILIKNQGVKMDKSIVDMNGALFIDDHRDNLVSSNADTKVCFGNKYQWNEKWKGLWLNNWQLVEQCLL